MDFFQILSPNNIFSGKKNSDKMESLATESHPFSRPVKCKKPTEAEMDLIREKLQKSTWKPANLSSALNDSL